MFDVNNCMNTLIKPSSSSLTPFAHPRTCTYSQHAHIHAYELWINVYIYIYIYIYTHTHTHTHWRSPRSVTAKLLLRSWVEFGLVWFYGISTIVGYLICYFSKIWYKGVKKEPYNCPSAFDHFIGRPQRLCKVICCCEFIRSVFSLKDL